MLCTVCSLFSMTACRSGQGDTMILSRLPACYGVGPLDVDFSTTVWKEAGLNKQFRFLCHWPQKGCSEVLTPHGGRWCGLLSQGDSHSSPELHGASAERMIFLCMQLAQRGIQLLGESWGTVACKKALRSCLDTGSLVHTSSPEKTGLFWDCKNNGTDNAVCV